MNRFASQVESGRVQGVDFLSYTRKGVPMVHAEVPMGRLKIQPNSHHCKKGEKAELSHDFRFRPEAKLVGTVTVVRFQEHFRRGLAFGLTGRFGRFSILPETYSIMEKAGRYQVYELADYMSSGRVSRRFASRPYFGSLGTTGTWSNRRVAPFLTLDEKPSGEDDMAFFYPTTDEVMLDPNWFVVYVQNLEAATSVAGS